MIVLRNIAIRHKLTSIIMLTCAGALLLAGCAFIGWEWFNLRLSMIQSLSTQAEMIADNCKAALAFGDTKDAEETLGALHAVPSILFTCVRTKSGEVFASYARDKADERSCLWEEDLAKAELEKDDHHFMEGFLVVHKPIVLDGENIGIVCLQSDLSPMYVMLKRNAQTIFAVILLACLAAYFVSSRLQRIISEPILGLAESATRIGKGELNHRVEIQSKHELGHLAQSFNNMAAKLKDSYSSLEAKVKERTAELTSANVKLEEEITERKKAEDALENAVAEWETTFNSAKDPIMLIDSEFRIIRANLATSSFLGKPLDEILGRPCYELVHGTDAPIDMCPQKKAKQTREHVETELHTPEKDVYLLISTNPILDDEGNVTGAVHITKDITERKRAEKELKEAHKKLVEASHQAGMAEVAADVLHNVGNVLNSINVSTTLISEKVSASKAANLKKAADMIAEHTEDLGTFLSEDARGKHIPAYLTKVTRLLIDDQADIVELLLSLAANVEHIKQVIGMQQSYAKASGVEVPTDLAEVLENAIEINSAGLDRHRVRLTRDFAKLPQVNIDKQRVLQILVNLISNAKYSLSKNKDQERLITIRFYRFGEERLRIEVIDNGAGISKENLTKIFRHGFTTKSEGHGFGLHSGALAAKEIGGALTVYSDGKGRGARFTLELPYRPVGVVK